MGSEYSPEFIALALEHSRNFASANPRLSRTTVEHIEGLCNIVESLNYASTLRQQAGRVDEGVIDALRTIADWNLPETGETWPSGGPVSYEAQYGSNGARDYMRKVARAALTAALAQNTPGEDSPLRSIMDNNAWRAAMVGLCSPTREADVSTPDLAADHLRKRLHAERARAPAVDGVRFVAWMIDNREGCYVTEEGLQGWLAEFLREEPAAPSQRAEVK